MLRVLLALAVCTASTACLNSTPPPAAPDTLDGNLRWWFANHSSSKDAEATDAVAKLGVAGKSDTRTSPLKSQMARLDPTDLGSVELEGVNDPAAARGFLILNLYACTLDKLQAILIARDQASQYTGVYDAYDRTYTSDEDAWSVRTTPTLTWDVAMKASLPVSDTYSALIRGAIRRIPGAAPGTGGDVLVVRTFLPSPAAFAATSTSYFKQDYQLEIYWEQESGRIFHAYGMWREMKVGGFNLTTEDNGMFNLLIDNLIKWDDQTAVLCARP